MPVIISGSTGISGTDGSAGTPAVQGTDTNTGMFFPAADQIAFAEGGVEAMRLDASGNVGIGTSSPVARLDVNSQIMAGGTNGQGKYLARNSGGVTIMDFGVGTGTGFGDSIGLFNLTPTGLITFGTNSTERARIDNGGNFLLGITAEYGRFTSARTDAGGWCIAARTTGAGAGLFSGFENETARFVVYGNGDSFNRAGVWGSLSDARLKENIVDATPKLESLNRVRVVNYNLKTDPDQKLIGVVAQELEQIFPGLVEETPALDASGSETGVTHKAVKYSVFVPMLIKALQEQQVQIEELKARVAALEAR